MPWLNLDKTKHRTLKWMGFQVHFISSSVFLNGFNIERQIFSVYHMTTSWGKWPLETAAKHVRSTIFLVGDFESLSKNFPTDSWSIPQTPQPTVYVSEFFSFGG